MSSSLCCTLPMRPACEWLREFLQSNQARWFLIYAGSRPPRPLGSKWWTSHPAYNTVSKNAASFPSRLWRYRQKILLIWNSLKHPDEQSNQLPLPCISHDMSRKRATESGATFSFVVFFVFFGDYIQQIPPFQLNKETRSPKWLTCFEINQFGLKCAGCFREVQTKDTVQSSAILYIHCS